MKYSSFRGFTSVVPWECTTNIVLALYVMFFKPIPLQIGVGAYPGGGWTFLAIPGEGLSLTWGLNPPLKTENHSFHSYRGWFSPPIKYLCNGGVGCILRDSNITKFLCLIRFRQDIKISFLSLLERLANEVNMMLKHPVWDESRWIYDEKSP